MSKWRNRFVTVTALGLLLSGCNLHSRNDVASVQTSGTQADMSIRQMVADLPSQRLQDPYIQAGLNALESKDYAQASEAFNRALKYVPDSSWLHFLNALTYHLQTANGDSSRLELAKVGYDLALRHDPANYWAAYQLGQISFREKAYGEAQDAFAYGLLYAPDNQDFMYALAVASYQARDLETALYMAQMLEEVAPERAGDLALIYAAAGKGEKAESFLKKGAVQNASFRQGYVKRRVGDWQAFYRNGAGRLLLAQADGFDKVAKELSTDVATATAKTGKAGSKNMTLVDVVIIRSEERHSTSKGVNLLNGLSSTLSGTLWSMSDSRTIDKYGANSGTTTYTINPSFSLSASYSLNIFNDNYDRNEVLARPTLVALDNTKSEFFTGSVFHVELPGAAGSVGAVEKVPVGVRLEVTPLFLNDEEVQLSVTAGRAFIEGQSADAGFSNFTQVTQNSVSANVAMKFGDTLVLSGLSEKETQNLRDGVPVLQDLPGIQYLFSNEATLDYTKSVMVLITPRKPGYTHKGGASQMASNAWTSRQKDPKFLKQLKETGDWAAPAPNMAAVFHHLRGSAYFTVFRSGDLSLEDWHTPERLERMTREAVGFLYY